MRVMPSVTETMEPTLRASVTDLKFSIRCLMRSEISVALMAISQVLLISSQGMSKRNFIGGLSGQFISDAIQPGAQRSVDDQIAAAQDSAADEAGVSVAMQTHLALEPALERARERLLLAGIKRRGGGYRHVGDAERLVLQRIEER